MANELLTGVSGHIGFRVLAEALKSGYRIRAVVRKASQADTIKSSASVEPYVSQLEFAIIPDFGADDAFQTHIDAVSYIIHVAAPQFTTTDVVNVAQFAAPTIAFTKNILKAASETPSVRGVIFTSSITTLLTGEGIQGGSDTIYTSQSNVAKDLISPAPKEAAGPLAYVISKVLSSQLVLDYVATTNPRYWVVNILPGTTIGRNELASNANELTKGSNLVALSPLLGISLPPVHSVLSQIDDVAIAHVKALDVKAASGTVRNILPLVNTAASPGAFSWDDSIGVVKSKFPAAIKSHVFPLGGTVPKIQTLVDTSGDEIALGTRFKGYAEAVIDLVSQFVQLAQVAQT
ncbi:hypothetical protein ACJZ2D_003762 [Fusarium nematophilum]